MIAGAISCQCVTSSCLTSHLNSPFGTVGTGGTSSWIACAFAVVEICGSDACLNRIMLNRLVLDVCCWIGGEGGGASSAIAEAARRSSASLSYTLERATSYDAARSETSMAEWDVGKSCSPRLKKECGCRALRRLRSLSLPFGLKPRKGIAGMGEVAVHLQQRRHS